MIETKSSFYFIESVDESSFYLDFDEGGPEIFAEVGSGHYTHSDLALAIQNAMNSVGGQSYSVIFNRDERTFTISASSNFSLLISSGTHVGANVFSLLGFTGPDLTGSNSYTGEQAGIEYLPQFKIQDWVDQEDLQKAAYASKNKSANGIVETVTFGIEKFFEMNILFITDIEQGAGSLIETSVNGVSKARNFLRFITSQREIEFMPDRNNKSIFYKLILESTEESSDGTGYRLKELYTKNLPYYFETGKLVFRLVEV